MMNYSAIARMMMRSRRSAGTAVLRLSLSLAVSGAVFHSGVSADVPRLEPAQAEWVGNRIFRNECNLKISCLTSWNAGENFPSLGIGHFIWYRQGQQEPFRESFPRLLAFYEQQGVALPGWLRRLPSRDAPWTDRQQFLAELDSPRMRELRAFLADTRAIQTRFIVRRLHRSIDAIAEASDRPAEIRELFDRLGHASPPRGLYALIDYVNFKGEGTAPQERYNGQGWGLLQVLERMLADGEDGRPLLERFADAARAVLSRRVRNAPSHRNEEQWLDGWFNRIETYTAEELP